MIQRLGLSARNRRPISAATSRTCATTVLSSVSGMVKNCGACGSMAPPITVDIMASLLCRKNIAGGKLQQGDRDRSAPRACRTAARPVLVGSGFWKYRSGGKPSGGAHGRIRRTTARLDSRHCENLIMRRLKLGKLDAIPLRNYVYF